MYVDPRDLVVGYGQREKGEKRYILVTRMFRPSGSRVGAFRTIVFESDSKSAVIAEAQRRKGWEPINGDEQTYGQQIVDNNGEAR